MLICLCCMAQEALQRVCGRGVRARCRPQCVPSPLACPILLIHVAERKVCSAGRETIKIRPLGPGIGLLCAEQPLPCIWYNEYNLTWRLQTSCT